MGQAPRRIYIVVLSGSVAAGKTTLARGLNSSSDVILINTREVILSRLPSTPRSRAALQAAGEQLDELTRGRWVADETLELIKRTASATPIVIDAVKIPAQIESVRTATSLPVFHVHLTSPFEVLRARYAAKPDDIHEMDNYADVAGNSTESQIGLLSDNADLVIDTSATTPDDAVRMVLTFVDRAMS